MPKAKKTIHASEVNAELPQKRRYTKRAPKPSAAPAVEPPNPAIIALQQDIVEMVQRREQAQQGISQAMAAVSDSNSRLQIAQQNFQNLEREVQYRMSLIHQMKGSSAPLEIHGAAHAIFAAYDAPQTEYPNGMGVEIPAGVSSIPSRQAPPPTEITGGRRVRSESAEGFRDDVATRAAI